MENSVSETHSARTVHQEVTLRTNRSGLEMKSVFEIAYE